MLGVPGPVGIFPSPSILNLKFSSDVISFLSGVLHVYSVTLTSVGISKFLATRIPASSKPDCPPEITLPVIGLSPANSFALSNIVCTVLSI